MRLSDWANVLELHPCAFMDAVSYDLFDGLIHWALALILTGKHNIDL
jgi:hypothetical protein